ncbi:hypothetical protein WICPIJ_006476 [Wickerhamomyces pijperi]|uniref:Fcf2 pre-rRNA processing C-terminal domain-containing protein n=1 Tax=Wickerhamomyces pijperi TaxID=599730 RepID=A0A9P8TKY7_WICPI|nr:hypothetical protein WICPIJ_006476 [Wickerhamomyces pijperi]
MSKDQFLSPITETLNFESSDEEEVQQDQFDELDLDDLFDELKKHSNELKGENEDEEAENLDEFKKIEMTISKLPKVGGNASLSGLNHNSANKNGKQYLLSAKNDPKAGKIVSISDPIALKPQSKSNEKNDAGDKWFGMPKGELTESVKNDMKVIEKRAALDPKRHYKKDKWKVPEYFQMGTIIEGNTEFYSSRLKRKERHSTILESVMNDKDTKHYFKRRYDEVQTKKTSGKKSFYKGVKDSRRKF